MLSHRSLLICLVIVLAVSVGLGACGKQETGEGLKDPSPSPVLLSPTQTPTRLTDPVKAQGTDQPVIKPTPTLSALGLSLHSDLDLTAGPVVLPLEILIPALNISAPVVGVGITPEHVMDAPRGSIGDPIWRSVYWYRGSGIPGDPGVATIAGHVNDPLGQPEIFSHLEDLEPGDQLIIQVKNTTISQRFIIDEVKVYSVVESSQADVLTKIFGIGPVKGIKPQPAPDGLSHLTLITCAGYIINGQFDRHTVVFATRVN